MPEPLSHTKAYYFIKRNKKVDRVKFSGKEAISKLIKDIRESTEGPSKTLRQDYPNIARAIKAIRENKKFSDDDLLEEERAALEQLIDKKDVEVYNRLIEERKASLIEESMSSRPVPSPARLRGVVKSGTVAEMKKKYDGSGAGEEQKPSVSTGSGKKPPADSKLSAADIVRIRDETRAKVEADMKAEAAGRAMMSGGAMQEETRERPTTSTAAPAPPVAAPAPAQAPPVDAPAPAQRKPPKQTDILDPTPVTSVDLIPNERRSAEYKSAKQLRDDIEFFFESFPGLLEKEMRQYIKLPKTKKAELARFHRMIMGKLQPSASISPEQKKVGVVISADEYIKQAINKALIDAKMLSMSPADVVELSVKGVDKMDNSESFGPYEVKRSKSGKLAAQREPIYRYVPQVNEEAVAEPPRSMLRVKKRETLPQTAKRQVRSNPFLRRETNMVRLKYLY
jgi:hypothetical protein